MKINYNKIKIEQSHKINPKLAKKGRKNKEQPDKENTNSKTDSNITILTITSNVNGLNTLIKGRDRQSGEGKKQDPTKCCQCILNTKSQMVKSKKMEKIYIMSTLAKI